MGDDHEIQAFKPLLMPASRFSDLPFNTIAHHCRGRNLARDYQSDAHMWKRIRRSGHRETAITRFKPLPQHSRERGRA